MNQPIHSPIHPSFHPPIHPSIHPSVHPSIRPSTCTSLARFGDSTDDSGGSDSGRTSCDEDDDEAQSSHSPSKRRGRRGGGRGALPPGSGGSQQKPAESRKRGQTAAARRRRRRRMFRRLLKRVAGWVGMRSGKDVKLSRLQALLLLTAACLVVFLVAILLLPRLALVSQMVAWIFPPIVVPQPGLAIPDGLDMRDSGAPVDPSPLPRIRISFPTCHRDSVDIPCMIPRVDNLVFWTHNFQAAVDGRRQVWLDHVMHDVDAGAKPPPPQAPGPAVSKWWPTFFEGGRREGESQATSTPVSNGQALGYDWAAAFLERRGRGGRAQPHPQKVTIPVTGLSMDEVHNLTVVLADPAGYLMASDMILFAIPSQSSPRARGGQGSGGR